MKMTHCMQVPPSDSQTRSKDELEDERARLAAELADAKRKFLLVAKRKQQEYSKKVCTAPYLVLLVLVLNVACNHYRIQNSAVTSKFLFATPCV